MKEARAQHLHGWEHKDSLLFQVGAWYHPEKRVSLSDWKCKSVNITYAGHKEHHKGHKVSWCLEDQFQSEDKKQQQNPTFPQDRKFLPNI